MRLGVAANSDEITISGEIVVVVTFAAAEDVVTEFEGFADLTIAVDVAIVEATVVEAVTDGFTAIGAAA